MSSYFDHWSADVRNAAMVATNDDDFLYLLVRQETARVQTINLVTGDREFPDDFRERIQAAIAIYGVSIDNPSPEIVKRARARRHSELCVRLHDDFHELASARIETRFGRLNDNPGFILKLRDAHDAAYGKGDA